MPCVLYGNIIYLFIYYWLVRDFRLWTNFRFYISYTYFVSLPSLLSTLLYCTPLIILSLKTKNQKLMTKKLLQLWAFASLLCFLLVVPSRLVLPFSSLLLLLVLLVLLESHFLCPLVLLLFHILLLHGSGLFLSFYIICIFFSLFFSVFPCFGLVSTSESC